MSEIIIIDTTIFLNILKVPGRSQQFEEVWNKLQNKIKGRRTSFVLPVTAIWETGNFIAKIPNGRQRREYAQKFREQVIMSLNGKTPFTARPFPEKTDLLKWLVSFPDAAQKSKSEDKPNEGLSWGDHSIVGEWEKIKAEQPAYNVFIWSTDIDLMAYGENE